MIELGITGGVTSSPDSCFLPFYWGVTLKGRLDPTLCCSVFINMALTRIACPDCGAALKSPSGFTVGKNVCCPKCETHFTVEDPVEEEVEAEDTPRKKRVQTVVDDEDDDDDDQPKKKKKKKKKKANQSYKNSAIRYAIFGVLVTTMLVLGVFLIFKKKPEANEQARADESSPPADKQKSPSPSLPRVNQGDQSPKMQKQFWEPTEGPPDEPAMNEPAAKKFREMLIGKWRMEFENKDKKPDSATIEYKSNGLYVAVLHDREENRQESMTGTWKGVKTFIDPNDGRPIGLSVEITLQKAFTQKLEIVFNPPDEILQQYFGPQAGVKLNLLKYYRVKE